MPRVLVVDDEKNLRLLYEKELQDEGYDVAIAADASAALAMIKTNPPDLIVLDIRMPGMDGLEAMDRILSHHHRIPIILNTAYTNYRHDFQSWSADAYVVKSSDLSELKREIRRLLKSGGKT